MIHNTSHRMVGQNNPFTSSLFTSIWRKHFCGRFEEYTPHFINGVSFFKHPTLPLYTNVGRNLTKGISYELSDGPSVGLKNSVFLLYDVPGYFDIHANRPNKNIGSFFVHQYPGFLINLEAYSSLEDYMKGTFSKGSRYKLNKYHKRLENCFDIGYKMYYGDISQLEYDAIFTHFRKLLEKRFEDKQISNNNLDQKEWEFYYEVALPMILDKKASLFVIYDGDLPIGITLNYLSDSILFDAITVFDIDYAKFHVGSISIMKQIEWCIAHKLKILDFSKGHFDYKERWANLEYPFEYHIYYDQNHLFSIGLANSIKYYFQLKQYLREKKVNEWVHRISHKLRSGKAGTERPMAYTFEEVPAVPGNVTLEPIDVDANDNGRLKKAVYDFLYLHQEKYKGLQVYKLPSSGNTYYIQGKSYQVKIILQA